MKKGENFYRRDPGKALSGMASLSLEERAVYNTVLDLLYLTWRPLEDNPKYIAGHCNCAVQKLNPVLRSLVAKGKLIRFVENGQAYISDEVFDRERLAIKGPAKTRSGRGEVGEKSASVEENPPICQENVEEKLQVTALDKTREDKSYYTDSARAIDRPFLDRLERDLREAGGKALIAASPGLLVLAPILGLLRPGAGPPCDIEADVLPTIRALSAKARPSSVQTWAYFAAACVAARDLRLSGAGESTAPAKISPQSWPEERWRAAVGMFAENGRWGDTCGPKPDEPGCWAPKLLLASLGYAPSEGGAEIIPFERSAA